MKKELVITGAGVGSLVAARLLKHAGYDINLPDGDDAYPAHHIIFKDTLFGAIEMTGDQAADRRTLEALEPGARAKLTRYHEPRKGSLFKKVCPSSVHTESTRHFSTPELQKVMQYPLLFAGLNPRTTPTHHHASLNYDPSDETQTAITVRFIASKALKNIQQHTVVLSKRWNANIDAVFNSTQWSGDPSFYIGKVTDTELYIQVPVTATAHYTENELARYADWVIKTAENVLHTDLRSIMADITVIGPLSEAKMQS